MKLWLLVPVKPFGEGKSRLAAVLAQEARAALSREMLARVLDQAQAAQVLAGTIVISRDQNALAQARLAGVESIPETGQDLNLALIEASQQAMRHGTEAILVLPADLPLVTAADIRQLYTLGATQAGVVIAPSPDGGTNALLLRPPHAIQFSFGRDSFARHHQLAATAGVPVQVFASPTLAFDVDRPEDLASLQRLITTGM